MIEVQKFEIGEGSGTTSVFVLQGKAPKDVALPPAAKRLKRNGFILTIPYPELAKYEEAMAGVPWVRAEDCSVTEESATYFEYIMDDEAEVTLADGGDVPDAEVVIADDDGDVDPRRTELLGKSLVNLRKEAKALGADIKGLPKEALIDAIMSAEAGAAPEPEPEPAPEAKKAEAKEPEPVEVSASTEPEPEPEPVAAEKPAKKAKAPKAEPPKKASYKDLQAQAASLGYGPVIGKSRAQLEEWVAAGPAAGTTEPTPKPEKATRKKREATTTEGPKRTSYEEQLEAAAKVLTDLRPLVAALKDAFGGSVHKTRIALSSIAAELDPDKRTAGNAMIGFPAGKTLRIEKSHKGFGACVYTIKFNDDGRSMALVGFEGEAHGRTIALDTDTGLFWLENEPSAPDGLKFTGIVEAAKRGMPFPNFNQLMRLITQRQYPRISWSTFIGSAEVTEV